MREFSVGQNWTEKMAGQDRKEGLVMDEAIYNSHIGNEEFYAKVSGMITERIKIRQSQKEKDKLENNSHDLVQAYGETEINDEDVKKAYETIERTQAEREQTGKKNNFEGR